MFGHGKNVRESLPARLLSGCLIALGLRGSEFHAPRTILCWFDTQVFTSRTQLTLELQCLLARLQISHPRNH